MTSRIGLVLQHSPIAGGGHSFETQLLKELTSASETWDFELVPLIPKQYKGGDLSQGAIFYTINRVAMAMSHLRAMPLLNFCLSLIGMRYSRLEKLVRKKGLMALIFASPNHLALGLVNVRFASTVWDLGHRDLPDDPDVSLGGIWAWREELFQSMVPRSAGILVDSESTSETLQRVYSVSAARLHRIGLLPEASHDVTPKSTILNRYVIYPANFWVHKNHELLLQAIAILSKEGRDLELVLTGSGQNEERIKSLAVELGIIERVHFSGHVSRSELSGLICGSQGVVMPSKLGPSNLPPLESALLGVPSIVSPAHEMGDLAENLTIVPDYTPKTWAHYIGLLDEGKVPLPRVVEISVQRELGHLLRDLGVDSR